MNRARRQHRSLPPAADRARSRGAAWRNRLLPATLGLTLWVACAPQQDPYQAHLSRELSFLHTGVDVDAERRATVRALERADLHVVAERSAHGMRALGAASTRFERTAVRVITIRGVVQAEDAARDDLWAPGRLHLLEEAPSELGGFALVGWVHVLEGDTAGCARLRVIDPQGRPLAVRVPPADTFGSGCLGGLERGEGGRLWGRLVFPSFTAGSTPGIELPLAPVKPKLDAPGPITELRMDEREGWLQDARAARQRHLAEQTEFALRHAVAFEMAALAMLAGESREDQRALYTQHAGSPDEGFERQLWARSVAHIEAGWPAAATACAPGTATEAACPAQAPDAAEEPESDDVLQGPVHGQEAQKEELTR